MCWWPVLWKRRYQERVEIRLWDRRKLQKLVKGEVFLCGSRPCFVFHFGVSDPVPSSDESQPALEESTSREPSLAASGNSPAPASSVASAASATPSAVGPAPGGRVPNKRRGDLPRYVPPSQRCLSHQSSSTLLSSCGDSDRGSPAAVPTGGCNTTNASGSVAGDDDQRSNKSSSILTVESMRRGSSEANPSMSTCQQDSLESSEVLVDDANSRTRRPPAGSAALGGGIFGQLVSACSSSSDPPAGCVEEPKGAAQFES